MVSFILCAALVLRKLGFDLRSLHRVTSPAVRTEILERAPGLTNIYSETPLIRIPTDQKKLAVITGWP